MNPMSTSQEPEWDSTEIAHWDPAFKRVQIPSSRDGVLQPAMTRAANAGGARPLLVSLHTWSGGYEQKDQFADIAIDRDWHYIRPHFRGPNCKPEACLSELAISDVDDAIDWAIAQWNVDPAEIVIRGASGGGMATCGMFMKTRHAVKEFHAWVPISDVERWYYESRARNAHYADEILQCVGTDAEGKINAGEARRRSPLYMDIPAQPSGPLHIYAGIHDGYKGSVPVSQSILLFNRLAAHFGEPEQCVDVETSLDLLSRAAQLDHSLPLLVDRPQYLYRATRYATLSIFEGAHEGLIG